MAQRSAILFWLLLAATLSVDAVAFSWLSFKPYPEYAVLTFDALILSQLSIVCIWSALDPTRSIATRIAPFLAVMIASLATAMFSKEPLTSYLAYHGIHTLLLLATLWLLKRTRFWQRLSGTSANWRYSIAHLLVLMTVAAVLAAVVRNSRFFETYGWTNIAFVCGSVALAVVSVVSWSLSVHWLLRLAGVLGFAILGGAAFSITLEPFVPVFVGAHYLIQGVILSIWIGCGLILPVSYATVPAET